MGRTYLIDGYNLLHQVPEFSQEAQELEMRRERLLRRLVSLSAIRGLKLRVIFDGSRAVPAGKSYPGISVYFATPSADHYIRAVIGQSPGRRDLVIVSSDQKDIGNYARICGIEWMTSQEFWQWLNSPVNKRRPSEKRDREDTGAPPGWTAADDEKLRRAFGDDETEDSGD